MPIDWRLYDDLLDGYSGRCFLLGNGPSLIAQLPLLAGLKDEATFTCNWMPRWTDLPFTPTFFGVTEEHNAAEIILQQHDDEVREAWGNQTIKFAVNPTPIDAQFLNQPKNPWVWVEKDVETVPMRRYGFVGLDEVDKDGNRILPPLKTGRTSPLTLTQVAAWMGFREFYFLGVDFSEIGYCYDVTADPGVTVHERTIRSMKPSFEVARKAVEAVGGKMVSCTPDSPINGPLPYVPLEEILGVNNG